MTSNENGLGLFDDAASAVIGLLAAAQVRSGVPRLRPADGG